MEPVSIGVPSIPTPTDPSRPPVVVPSAPFSTERLESEPEVGPDQPVVPLTVAPELAGFAPEVASQLRSYVYLLIDPRTGRAFGIGRGRGNRCFRHVRAARASGDRQGGSQADRGRPFTMLERIRQIEAGGRPVRIDILRYGLSRAEAALIEVAVGEAMGLSLDADLPLQRHAAADSGMRLAKRAKIKPGHQVVLLRLGGASVPPAYEDIRHGWRIGRRWIDPRSPRSPKWAAVVTGEVVTAVYRIDGWEPSPVVAGGPASGRYSLVGRKDAKVQKRYRGKTVAAYLGGGSPSGVTYVRCGPHWVNSAS